MNLDCPIDQTNSQIWPRTITYCAKPALRAKNIWSEFFRIFFKSRCSLDNSLQLLFNKVCHNLIYLGARRRYVVSHRLEIYIVIYIFKIIHMFLKSYFVFDTVEQIVRLQMLSRFKRMAVIFTIWVKVKFVQVHQWLVLLIFQRSFAWICLIWCSTSRFTVGVSFRANKPSFMVAWLYDVHKK